VKPTLTLSGALAALCLLIPLSALADVPDRTLETLDGIGGEGVTGDANWSFVVDRASCALSAYLFDYASMDWVFDGVVDVPGTGGNLANFCISSEFGGSSSSAGEVLVVGAPGLQPNGGGGLCQDLTPNNRGGFSVYELVNGTWTLQTVGNACGPGRNLVVVPGGTSNGDRVGERVSIGRLPGTDRYVIAVGAPGYDTAGNNNVGRYYFYEYNAASGALNLRGFATGTVSNAGLGNAVTINAVGTTAYIMVGGPGYGGNGRVFVVEIGGTLSLRETLVPAGAAPGEDVGQDLSLSDRYALASGLNNAYVWENTGTAASPLYGANPSVEVSTGGGDVSQSAFIAAFGEGGGLFSGAQVLRDPLLDSGRSEEVIVDTGALGGDQSDVGGDIRLIRESLWFANGAADRAILARFPGGFGRRLDEAFRYEQLSLPCDAVGKSVSQVFGSLGSSAGSGGADFDLWIYDPADVTTGRPYRRLDDGYVFSAADADFALWMAVATPGYVAPEDCNGFSLPDTVYASPRPNGLPDNVRAHKDVTLPPPALDPRTGDTFARVLVNNPFPRGVAVEDLRYRNAAGVVKDLAQAEADGELAAILYIYDPDNAGSTTQGYRPVTPSGTPPFNDRVEAHEGFWVRVLDNGAAGQVLQVPLVE